MFSSVADPHHFDAYPDQTFQNDADPNLQHWFWDSAMGRKKIKVSTTSSKPVNSQQY